MATTIVTKNSSTASAVPTAGQLVQGELAVNVADKKLYTEDNAGSIIVLADGVKLAGIEALADVTDTANVTAAGALMDSELTNITAVKALDQGVATTDSPTFAALTSTGEITANGGIALGDNDYATFGASDDLQIYHNGSNSIITETGTGNLYLGGDNLLLTNGSLSAAYLEAITGGAVNIYHNGSTKLATTATGIDVTGTVTMDGLTVSSAGTPASLNRTDGNNALLELKTSGITRGLLGADATSSGLFYSQTAAELMRISNNGDISFYEDTGTTAKFFWDASAESLGIGGTPAHSLDVVKAGSNIIRVQNSASSADASFYATNTVGTGIFGINATGQYMYGLGNFPLLFYANAAERMRIDSSGRLLVGLTGASGFGTVETDTFTTTGQCILARTGGNVGIGGTPTDKLTLLDSGNLALRVKSTGAANEAQVWTHNDAGAINGMFMYGSTHSTYGAIAAGEGAFYSNTNVNIMSDSPTGVIKFSTGASGGAERMRIDSSGNVGIGISPSARLHSVVGAAGSGTLAQAMFGYLGGSTHYLDANNIIFRNGSASETARIDSSGNLLVGTTSGDAKLHVGSNLTSLQAFRAFGNTAGDTSLTCGQFSKYDNNTTTSQVFVNFTVNNGGIAQGQINANGASQAAFGTWSDSRLKENITDLPSQLANITALRPVEFDYIESEGGGHQIGFIAQEVESIYPDLVGEREDGMKTLTGIGKMEARLIKAIQEQQTLIESLTARIAALEE